MYLNQYSGRGIRVAVVDSGVHADHPHVGGIAEGVAVCDDGSLSEDFLDRLGHGTAVAAAIREKAPDASIIAIRVFWQTLATGVSVLVRGIDEACARDAAVINLSLGTSNTAHTRSLAEVVDRANRSGALLVGALDEGGVQWLPGSLDGVIPVRLDWQCERDAYRVVDENGRRVIVASAYPRDIPNVPRERNLKGISFAVANASGFVARALEATPRAGAFEILETLESESHR